MAKLPKAVTREVDPDVKIPAAVLAAAAFADAAYEQPAEPTPPIEEPAPPPPAPVTEPAVVAPEPAIVPDPASSILDDQTWKHKYESMKGRFERSEKINTANTDRISKLETFIASMNAQPVAAAPAPSIKPLVTAEEREAFGDEFLDVAARAAHERMSPEVASLRSMVDSLQNRLENVGGAVAQNARQQMQTDLGEQCPEWLELNENEKFLDWLALPDPFSGTIRHTLLKQAYDQNDTRRTLAFFRGFLAEEAALAPRPSEPAPAAPAAASKVPLESFAAPGRAKTTATPVPVEKPTFTNAQVTQFYADVAARKYAGRDDEKNRIEAQMHDAAREGRIR